MKPARHHGLRKWWWLKTITKTRMCVDYSQTVTKVTHLDAYPLPSVQSVNDKVSRYKYFSTLDLKNAYHRVMLLPKERKFTAFEANGQLYQFKRVPFGLKNAVPCFQRVVNQIISKFDCQGTFAYLDDIAVCGHTREEHDTNLEKFLKAAKQCNLTLSKTNVFRQLLELNCSVIKYLTVFCNPMLIESIQF